MIDFTSNHTWHRHDDLLWSALVAHKKGVPLLIEEVGVMSHEFPDRSSSRTLKAVAVMLERKLALAFGGGGAGFLQWLWNCNSYLPSDNEASIGLLLADGAGKPELQVYSKIAEFAARIRPWLGEVEEPSVCVVFPQGDGFSVRPTSLETHRQAVRTLEYGLGLSTRVVGEYQSEELGRPKLIVLPTHDTLSEGCWKNLLQAVERGAWLTIAGDFRRDANYHLLGQLDFLARNFSADLVSNVETLQIGKKRHEVLFPTAGKVPLRKLRPAGPNRVVVQKLGKGTILLSPIPLEAAANETPLLEFYRLAAEGAGLTVTPRSPGRLSRRIAMPKADLYALVNETGIDLSLRSLLPRSCRDALTNGSLPAGRSALYLIEKKSARCLAAYQPPHLE